jgi:hypothetical protein
VFGITENDGQTKIIFSLTVKVSLTFEKIKTKKKEGVNRFPD